MNWKQALLDKGFVEITDGKWKKNRKGKVYSVDNNTGEVEVIGVSLKKCCFGFSDTLAVAIGDDGRRYALRHNDPKGIERFFERVSFKEWKEGVFLYPGYIFLSDGSKL